MIGQRKDSEKDPDQVSEPEPTTHKESNISESGRGVTLREQDSKSFVSGAEISNKDDEVGGNFPRSQRGPKKQCRLIFEDVPLILNL